MGISEFALHNVLRTYTRQDRLGKLQKVKAAAAPAPEPTDKVSLSAAGRKVQWVGQLAAELVDRRHPALDADARSVQVRNTKQEFLERHQKELGDANMPLEALKARLRPLYVG